MYLVPILEPLTNYKYTKIRLTLPQKSLNKIPATLWEA